MRRFSKTRPVLIMIFALAIVAQPLAGNLCHCDEHGDAGSMADVHAGMHEHGEPHDELNGADMADHHGMMNTDVGMLADHSGTDHCGSHAGVCQCDACGQSFGLVVQTGDAFMSLPASSAIAPPHYLEPPESRALRPPIRA